MKQNIYKLMLKQHYETGVSYLCVTKQKNFRKYRGSGLRWNRLLNKYPESEIRTNLIFQSKNLNEFNAECLKYSVILDVVDNKDFANLVPELGYDSELGTNLEIWWRVAPAEDRQRAIDKRMSNMKETYVKMGLPLMHYARLGLDEYCKLHGVTNAMQIPEIKEKVGKSAKKTILERYGVEHNMQIPGVAEKVTTSRKSTFLQKHGVEYYSQIKDNGKKIAEKREATLFEKYGYSNPSQIPEFKDKISASIKKTLQNKPIIQCRFCIFQTKSIALHENHCLHNPNRTIRELHNCEHCGIETTQANITRWHNNNCKKKE